jgi:hypothetical protein
LFSFLMGYESGIYPFEFLLVHKVNDVKLIS